jgi:Rhs element Vgr protein
MPQTTENNITRKSDAAHKVEVFLSSSANKEGKLVNESYTPLHVVIGKSPNKIAFAKLTIQDGDVAQQNFPISNEKDFEPGQFITIKMGDVNEVAVAFKGIIVKHGVQVKKGRKSLLKIDCRDVSILMTTQRKNKYFSEDITDSDAIKEIAKSYKDSGKKLIGLDQLEDTDVQHEGLVQFDQTDWDFILKRANAQGQLVYADNNQLITVTPSISEKEDYSVTWGDTIIDFEAEMDARQQFEEVELNTWEPSKQELFKEDLSNLNELSLDAPGNLDNSTLAKTLNKNGFNLFYNGQLNNGDQKALVKSALIRSKLSRIVGRVSVAQPTLIKPRKTLKINGVGERFNGLTYITGVRYEFAKNVWKTDIQFGLDADWSERLKQANQSAQDFIPVGSGLYIGIVTQVDDESGEDRVRVNIPAIDEKGVGVWARMSRPDAGEHRGVFFLPEEKDEVLVGFLNGDPRYPMILGMLNSSAKPAPKEGLKKDNLKGIYSKEGGRIEFDDKKRTIKIQNLSKKESKKLENFRNDQPNQKNNNTIILDDKDESILIQDKNNNTIQLNNKEIRIKGSKKIVLEAPEVMIEANKILNAKTGQTKFESKGATTVKGNPINLNP